MQTTTTELLNFLETKTRNIIESANHFEKMTSDELNAQPKESSWSVLQCLEHLNLYGDYYLPAIESRILRANTTPTSLVYKSGWLGNYFANTMQVSSNGTMKRMKSPKDKIPASRLEATVIQRFIKQQEQMLRLLKLAEGVDLQKIKVPISIAPFIKIQLGDCFRFVIHHNERHMLQAQRASNRA